MMENKVTHEAYSKFAAKRSFPNRNNVLERCGLRKMATQRKLKDSLRLLHSGTHSFIEHNLTVHDDEVDDHYNAIGQKKHTKNAKSCDKSPGTAVPQDIYNMIARSIAMKKKETDSILQLNKDKFESSPYTSKKLKLRPNLIYTKNNKDHIYQFSEAEGKGGLRTFSSSHYKVYGNMFQQGWTDREYGDVSVTGAGQQYMDKPVLKDDQEFVMDEIEKAEKGLIKHALFLRNKEKSLVGIGNHLLNTDTSFSQIDPIDYQESSCRQISTAPSNIRRRNMTRPRYGVLAHDPSAKSLQRKVSELRTHTLKKMESMNIRPPSQWRQKHNKEQIQKVDQIVLDTSSVQIKSALNLTQVLSKGSLSKNATPAKYNKSFMGSATPYQMDSTAHSFAGLYTGNNRSAMHSRGRNITSAMVLNFTTPAKTNTSGFLNQTMNGNSSSSCRIQPFDSPILNSQGEQK